MQKLIDYVKQPSNYYDFAKFKPTNPSQTQKVEYFRENMMAVMKNYVSYLLKESKVPAKNQTEFINKLQKNQIQQGELSMSFAEWLIGDTFFTYQYKKQIPTPQPPPQPRIYQNTTQNFQHQQTSTAPKPYPKPSAHNQSRIYQSENKRENTNSSSGPIFNISKLEHRHQQMPTIIAAQKLESHYQVPLSQMHKHMLTVPFHSGQPKRNYGHQNNSHHPTLQHYTPHLPDENKPFRQRFFEKLVDYFEYPERVANIKQDMTLMFQQKK